MASIIVLILIGFVAAPLRGASILAACLLALNRLHIFYSQQARSYALFCFLAGALLFWCLLMDRRGQKWMYWFFGSILMAALLYTHYFGAFYCAAIWRRKSPGSWSAKRAWSRRSLQLIPRAGRSSRRWWAPGWDGV